MALRYVPRGPGRLGMQLILGKGRNPAPALAQNGPNNLLRQFVSGEEITDLETRRVVGKQFFRAEFGKTSAEYMLPDCFGFPASLPSILAHSGIKGFSTQKLSASWQ